MIRRTDDQVIAELKSDSPLNKARAVFSSWCGKIDQAGAQRRPIGPIEVRRLEFEAVEAVVAVFIREWTTKKEKEEND